jgi:hypothetical protein
MVREDPTVISYSASPGQAAAKVVGRWRLAVSQLASIPPGTCQSSWVRRAIHYEDKRGAPSEYKRLTQGAERVSLNFRFRTGKSDLDDKAIVDIDRVVTFIADLRYTGDKTQMRVVKKIGGLRSGLRNEAGR